jgi:hypothetical protein
MQLSEVTEHSRKVRTGAILVKARVWVLFLQPILNNAHDRLTKIWISPVLSAEEMIWPTENRANLFVLIHALLKQLLHVFSHRNSDVAVSSDCEMFGAHFL